MLAPILATVALLVIFLGAGVWVSIGLIAVALSLLALFHDVPIILQLATSVWNTITSEAMIALPLFVLMAEILFRTRLSESLFQGLAPWAAYLPGRLLHINVLACTLFAAISGSSAATTATVGRITLSELLRRGYDDKLAIGSLAGAGTFGFLIPPSIIMIIYGILSETSVLSLFIAGIVPGVLLAGCYMVYLGARSLANPSLTGTAEKASSITISEGLRSFLDLAPVLFLILFVIGSMYGGIASPTEAAAVGVLGSVLVSKGQATLTWSNFSEAVVSAVRTSSMIGLIVAGAVFLSQAMAYLGIPRFISESISGLGLSPFALILLLIVFYSFLGCILEGMSAIVMTLPITLPLAVAAGYDKIWFGVFLVLMVEMAQITPPIGFNLFVIQALTGERIGKIAMAALPFFVIMLAFTIFLAIFPEIVMFLPNRISFRG